MRISRRQDAEVLSAIVLYSFYNTQLRIEGMQLLMKSEQRGEGRQRGSFH